MFTPVLIQLGEIQPSKEVKLVYSYDAEVYLITDILSTCDCTRVENSIPDRTITIYYTPKEIPIQVREQGKHFMDVTKAVTIKYLNTSNVDLQETLVFTATIKRK